MTKVLLLLDHPSYLQKPVITSVCAYMDQSGIFATAVPEVEDLTSTADQSSSTKMSVDKVFSMEHRCVELTRFELHH